MAVLKKKLKASALIEVLVALVIIVSCFGIASMMYVNITNSYNNRQLLSAQLRMNEIALKTKAENNFLEERIESNQLTIEKSVNTYKESKEIVLLTLKAFTKNGKIIASHRELIIVPHNE